MAIKYTTPEVAKNTTSRDIEALAAQECKLQEKSVEYTQHAEFVVTPDEGSGTALLAGCSNLVNLTINGELRAELYLNYINKLTVDSLMSVINALVDLTGENSKTLTLGATNLAKLSDEQKAVATNKNWVLK